MLSLIDLNLAFQITTTTPSTWAWVTLASSILLLLCSALASASEIAFFSLTPHQLAEVAEERRTSDSLIMQLRERGDRLLATILILNNLVNVVLSCCSTSSL
jgi:Mg2+/Co2+ transporter CorB